MDTKKTHNKKWWKEWIFVKLNLWPCCSNVRLHCFPRPPVYGHPTLVQGCRTYKYDDWHWKCANYILSVCSFISLDVWYHLFKFLMLTDIDILYSLWEWGIRAGGIGERAGGKMCNYNSWPFLTLKKIIPNFYKKILQVYMILLMLHATNIVFK